MGAIGCDCCDCATPDLIAHIAFNGVDKVPADWLVDSNCCPHVKWITQAYFGDPGIQLFETIYRNDAACSLVATPAYYCVRAYLSSIEFWFSKFSCDSGWWVAMEATIYATIAANTTPVCPSGALASGTVKFSREKFVASITAPTTITFTAADHYDWTAGGACHERGFCPTNYTGEITTDIGFCCGTILDPNCADPNITSIDFLANDFTFEIT